MEKEEKKTAPATEKKTTNKKVEANKEVKKAPKATDKKVEKVEKDVAKVSAKKSQDKKVETKKAVKQEEIENRPDEAHATLRYARISARKVKIVIDLIKGKSVDEALAILKYTPKASSEILEKLLNSAIANAENNNGMSSQKLYIADAYANQGPTLKRIRPAAKGSAVRIRKRTSHITIVLKENKD